jgi:hypothetical protein
MGNALSALIPESVENLCSVALAHLQIQRIQARRLHSHYSKKSELKKKYTRKKPVLKFFTILKLFTIYRRLRAF